MRRRQPPNSTAFTSSTRAQATVCRTLLLLAAALSMALCCVRAHAQDEVHGPRIGLVIANFSYPDPQDRLRGPVHDADVVPQALRKRGFSGIDGTSGPTLIVNANKAQMAESLLAFRKSIQSAGPQAIGLLYFTGQVVADRARTDSFLMPTDVANVDGADVAARGIGIRFITRQLQQLDQPLPLMIVVNACRNEAAAPASAVELREPDLEQPKGMLVALSATKIQKAMDCSVYGNVVADQIGTPGLLIGEAFEHVKLEVARRTNNAQIPTHHSSITDPLCLAGCTAAAAPQVDPMTSLKTAMELRPTGDIGQIAALERLARDSKSLSGLDLRGIFMARASLDQIDFSSSDLSGVNLAGASLANAKLGMTDMRLGQLNGTHMETADATKARFYFADATGASFRGLTAPQSNWTGATLRGANFQGAKLSGASFMLADLRDADFRGADLSGAFFVGAVLTGAKFDSAVVANTDLTYATGDPKQFTAAQQAKLCASMGRSDQGLRINLRRVTAAKADSSDSRYENLLDDWARITEGPMNLDRCGIRSLQVYGALAVYGLEEGGSVNGDLTFDLPAELIDLAHRSEAYVERVKAQVSLVNSSHKQGPQFRIVGPQQRELMETLKRNARDTALVSDAFLDRDSVRMYALKFHPDAYASTEWPELAERWSAEEQSRLKDRTQYKNQWHMFFPADMPRLQLGTDAVEQFKVWTVGRAKAYPDIVTVSMDVQNLRVPLWRAADDAKAGDQVTRPLLSFLQSEPYPAGMREFLRPTDRCLPLWTDGSAGIVLRLPKPFDQYETTVGRAHLKELKGRAIGVAMQVRVRGSETVRNGKMSAQFIDVDVLKLQLLYDDGKPIQP